MEHQARTLVDRPVSTVYNQWTQFETFPEFMEGVNRVQQLDDSTTRWDVEIAGVKRSFVAADATTDEFLGTVGFDRRDAERPGHLVPTANELELSYAFLPRHWGKGYATEAATLALDWVTTLVDDTVIVACTQAANAPSLRLLRRLGFRDSQHFCEFDAEQALMIKELDQAPLR